MAQRESVAETVVSAVLASSRALVAVSARSLAGVEERLTLTQFRVLVVLRSDGALTLTQVAERTGVVASSALRTVDRMVALGLVERRPSETDRREVRLALTSQGRDVVDGVTTARRKEIASILRRMDPETRRQLVTAFEAFSAAAGEPLPVPGADPLTW